MGDIPRGARGEQTGAGAGRCGKLYKRFGFDQISRNGRAQLSMIVVIFALPEESRDLRRALRDPVVEDGWTRGFLSKAKDAEEIRVTHTGVGSISASAKIAKLLSGNRPRVVVSSGYAGGLDPRLKISDLLLATNFSAPGLVALCRTSAADRQVPVFGCLTSQSAAVESIADKAALADETGAHAVDMETAAIAVACNAAGVPLLSVRAISDPASQPLPVPFEHWFDLARQRPRPLALVGYLARKPSQIAPFARFVRGLSPARLALTGFLVDLLGSEAFRNFSEEVTIAPLSSLSSLP
jgi:adenosylhomocysteine nucleosidase